MVLDCGSFEFIFYNGFLCFGVFFVYFVSLVEVGIRGS